MAGMLSAREAAASAGVSERTIRNWISSGKLPAEKTPAGFRISAEDLAERSAPAPVTLPSGLSDMVALVAKLQEENRVMAGRIGWLEAQVDHLKALPSPTSPERPISGATANGTVATSGEPSSRPRAWWRLWVALLLVS